jgi:malate/lactate dehydrogenase
MPLVTIVILGAGDVGAAVARQVAAADIASRVQLVDAAGGVAAGKALDIAQAAPVDRYTTSVSGTDDETAVAGAGIVVVADRAAAPGGEWGDDEGLALIRRAAGLNQQAAIVCAGSSCGALIDRGVHELGLSPMRLFGTAPEALRAAVVSLVSLEAEASPSDISLEVLGRAPGEVIVPWEGASIHGRRAVDVLAPPAVTRLESRVLRLWPPGPLALGGAAARVIRSMLARTPRSHVLQVALPRTERVPARSAMLPARVGPRGITGLEPPALSARDRVRLDTALAR